MIRGVQALRGEFRPEHFCDSDTLFYATAWNSCSVELFQTNLLESLILAQDERWRRA